MEAFNPFWIKKHNEKIPNTGAKEENGNFAAKI